VHFVIIIKGGEAQNRHHIMHTRKNNMLAFNKKIFSKSRACPQLEDSQADYRVIHRQSADSELTKMRRYALRDDQWDRIKDILPGREGHVGVTAKDNRLFVEAVIYRYRAGIPWRDLPERFGDPIKIHTRFSRWAKSGVWKKLFEMLASDADNEYAMIDSTIVRAHQHSAGAQKKTAKTRRSDAAKAG
jgi:transposase